MMVLVMVNFQSGKLVIAASWSPPSPDELAANDYILYFVNAGASTPDEIPPGEKLGLYQSKTEQSYNVDAVTGNSWGYTTTYKSSATSSSSPNKFDTVRYYDPPAADKVPKKGLEYKFDLPNDKYEVTLGFKNPWSTRESDIILENSNVDKRYTVVQGKEQTETYEVEVTDGELNIEVVRPAEGGSATSTWADPLVSFIVIKLKVDITKEVLQKAINKAESINRDDYTDYSLDKLDQAIGEAKAVLENGKAHQEEIDKAYRNLNDAYNNLATPYSSFVPGAVWNDTGGTPIQAHGGGIMKDGDTYYWYGEDKTNGYLPATGVHAYSSKDLYNWKDEGVVMRAIESKDQFTTDPYFADLYAHRSEEEKDLIFSDINSERGILERPKVIYNEKTKKYVLWLHVDGPYQGSDANYAKAKSGVAISDSPTGPFEYIESNRLNKAPEGEPVYGPDTGMARDMTLFKDDDGTAYVIYSSEENMSLYISKLTDDYLQITGEKYGMDYIRALPGKQREAPAMFKYDGKYYLMTSGATGWDPNQASYAVADSVLGDWTIKGDPSVGQGANTTFQSQSTYIIPVDPENGKFIYMGDRWNSGNLKDSRYIWLPLEFDQEGDMMLKWYDKWDLSDLDNKGKLELVTALPDAVTLGKQPELPNTIEIINSGSQQKVPVTWKIDEQSFSKPGPLNITGILPTLNNKIITHRLFIIPDNVKYFVSPGSTVTKDYEEMSSYMEDTLENKGVNDQVYDSNNGNIWGYSGGKTATTDGNDIFSSLRYIVKDSEQKDFTYTFEVGEGNYTVFAGFYDPWAVYAKGDRKADIFVNEKLVDSEYTYSDQYEVKEYKNRNAVNGKIEMKVQPAASVAGKPNSDSQISWIMIIDDHAELKKLIEIAETKEERDYSKASFALLKKAIKEAKEVIANSANQKEIDAAVDKLEAALDGLQRLVQNTGDMLKILEDLEKEGAFANNGAFRSLEVHLIAVNRFEQKEVAEKVVKHLNGFKSLLANHQKSALISEEAFNVLYVHTDYLIEKWQ